MDNQKERDPAAGGNDNDTDNADVQDPGSSSDVQEPAGGDSSSGSSSSE